MLGAVVLPCGGSDVHVHLVGRGAWRGAMRRAVILWRMPSSRALPV